MPTYDANLFDPPAPLAQVTLRNPQNTAVLSDVPMLLDSGADVTLIPAGTLERLNMTATDEIYELMGFDGRTSFASVARLEMRFLNRTFRGRFLLFDQEWGVIGRDILNHIALFFDGPSLTWNEKPCDQ